MDAHPGPAHTDPAPTSSAPADVPSARTSATLVDRIWELRRRAEKRAGWQRPAVSVLVATGFTVIANPALVPGGFPTALTALAMVMAVAITGGVIGVRRASVRGHGGSVTAPDGPARRWWRDPALAGPAMFAVVFLGNLIGAFDHWPVILVGAIVVGFVAALVLPRYQTADHLTGPRLEHAPELSAAGGAAVAAGDLATDVLELLVLQHHTGERRIAWCADVLGTDVAEIRDRIARGRRWLELPATEVHDPATATWVRLTAMGREALGYA